MNKSSHYGDRVNPSIAKQARRLQVHIRSHVLDSFDTIPIFSFLSSFKLACDSIGVHEELPFSCYICT